MKQKTILICIFAITLLLGGCGKSSGESSLTPSGSPATEPKNSVAASAQESGQISEATPTPADDDQVIEWTDPIVEQLFRRALGREEGNIWRSELEAITTFDITPNTTRENDYLVKIDEFRDSIHVGGFSLEDLKYCINLTEIRIVGIQLASIDFLSDMSNLKRVVLPVTQITDISPLRGMNQLEFLWIAGNSISDLSPLADLVSLKTLNISQNNITDITALSGLTQLEELTLTSNTIEDYTPLYGLQKLKTLYTAGGLSEEQKDDIQSKLPFCSVR